jgi:hypothetical protein
LLAPTKKLVAAIKCMTCYSIRAPWPDLHGGIRCMGISVYPIRPATPTPSASLIQRFYPPPSYFLHAQLHSLPTLFKIQPQLQLRILTHHRPCSSPQKPLSGDNSRALWGCHGMPSSLKHPHIICIAPPAQEILEMRCCHWLSLVWSGPVCFILRWALRSNVSLYFFLL